MKFEKRKTIRNTSYKYRKLGLSAIDSIRLKPVLFRVRVCALLLHEHGLTNRVKDALKKLLLISAAEYLSIVIAPPIQIPRLVRKFIQISSIPEWKLHIYFRFKDATALRRLKRCLSIEDEVLINNTFTVTGDEYLLMGLFRLARPCRLIDLEDFFGIHFSKCSLIVTQFISMVVSNFGWLITDNLPFWKDFIIPCHQKIRDKLSGRYGINYQGDENCNVFGFIDNTLYSTCRPAGPAMEGEDAPRVNNEIQKAFYSGWKKCHGLKWQTIDLPNGMIMHAWGGASIRHHDVWMLGASEILRKLDDLQSQNGIPWRIQYSVYGDSAYGWFHHCIRSSYKQGPGQPPLTQRETDFNFAMAGCRIMIEWDYRDLKIYWGFTHNRFALQIRQSYIADMILASMVLRNAYVCLYGSQTSKYFDMLPPALEDWFQV